MHPHYSTQPSYLPRVLALAMIVTLGFLGVLTDTRAAAADWSKGWDKLGSCTVRLGTEQDEIRLSHKGRMQKLVFEVRKTDVNFKDVKVQLLSGAVLDIPVRTVVKEGARTRVIDLPGEARTIKKIEFTYQSLRLRRAEVVVWGKKN